MVLVAPQKAANSQRVNGIYFIHNPPSRHKSHNAISNLLKYNKVYFV